jgi:DNA polymerase-3 subunit epsilon
MMENLALTRPLAFLDVETTGLVAQRDRLVEIAVVKVLPDGRQEQHVWRLNPRTAIPAGATAVHGITDADVASAPRFEQIVDPLLALLEGCDLAGFNLKRFDLRVLCSEVKRAGRELSLVGRALVDVMELFHRQEPRDLPAAVRCYLGGEHAEHHQAVADALATAEVLDAMLGRYQDLPREVEQLHRLFFDPQQVDTDGFFRRVEGEVRFAKGKYRSQPLEAVARESPDYLRWMLGESFAEDTKSVVEQALAARQSVRFPSSGPSWQALKARWADKASASRSDRSS